MKKFSPYLALFLLTFLAAPVIADPDTLARGKQLYNSADSCVAYHMADGKGQPGSIPPLAGSDWLKGEAGTVRTIAFRGRAERPPSA